MNPWYIDRSRNINENTKYVIKDFLFRLNAINPLNQKMDPSKVISILPDDLKNGRNPNAILTYLRDIGFIDKNNIISKNAIFLTKNRLTFFELIFELLFKRFYYKHNEIKVNPLVVIILTLYKLYLLNNDVTESYLTWGDCYNKLFKIHDYNQIDDSFIKSIIEERTSNSNHKKSEGVLDIWYNSLKNIGIFKNDENAHELKMDESYLDFYELINTNICKIITNNCSVELLMNKNQKMFEYLGNDQNGIISLVPEIKLIDEKYRNLDVSLIYNYLFSKNDCNDSELIRILNPENRGIFSAFRWCPRIALRVLGNENIDLCDKLIEFSLNENIESIESAIQIQFQPEFKDVIEEKLSKIDYEMYVNSVVNIRNPNLQRRFKNNLKTEFNCTCPICGINFENVLIGSHIKPFSKSLNIEEAFSKDNGLLLCTLHDSLFDRGYISIMPSGEIICSKEISEMKEILNMKKQNLEVRFLTDNRLEFLRYHFDIIFKKTGN